MKNKKLALLLEKLPEDKKDAFIEDMKNAEDYKAVVEKYGITLTEDEKAFLSSKVIGALSDAELSKVNGGGCGCATATDTCCL